MRSKTEWSTLVLPLLVTALWPAMALAAESAGNASDGSLPPWATGSGFIVAMIGGPVFAIWYAWYMTTNRIPAIEKAHADEVKVTREGHAAELSKVREAHATHLQTLMTNFREDVKTMWNLKREDETRFAAMRHEDDAKLALVIEKLADSIQDKGCRFESGHSNKGGPDGGR